MQGQCLRLGEEDDMVREKDRHSQPGRQRRTGNYLWRRLSVMKLTFGSRLPVPLVWPLTCTLCPHMNQLSDDSSESSFVLRCGYKTLPFKFSSCLGMGPGEKYGAKPSDCRTSRTWNYQSILGVDDLRISNELHFQGYSPELNKKEF